MKIELKNIKYFAAGSQETPCYNAALFVDGKKIGEVGNAGHGGCDEFHGDYKAYDKANEWCKENLPKWTFGDHGLAVSDDTPQDTDLENHCNNLLGEFLTLRDYKNAKSRKVLFTKKGDEKNIWQISAKASERERVINLIKGKPDTDKVLNELPDEDAIEIWKQAA